MTEQEGSWRVVIGGASGLVGTALTALLTSRGHRVTPLVRRRPAPDEHTIHWNPAAGHIDASALEHVDAVVHLGGASVAGGRWTARRKAEIRDSRLVSTRLLSETLARLKSPPRAFVCASAVGYYGSGGDQWLTEASPPGIGFLAELCQEWEAATGVARHAGVRVVNLRTGMVLSRHGGALGRMLPAFRKGLGGVIGNGQQYVSWIALGDLVRAIRFLLSADIAGPANAVTPNPVTNREFTRTLARVLHRPTLLPLPKLLVRAAFGEMGQALLLDGARVRPVRLQQVGFHFRYPKLQDALRHELQTQPNPGSSEP